MKNYFMFLLLFLSFIYEVRTESCEYQYDHTSTLFKWKAFKYTERTGVEGTFDKITVLQKTPNKSLEEFAENIKFKIDTTSVKSNNPERDEKIKTIFFGSMKDSREITGDFRNFKFKGETGSADLYIKMNSKESYIPIDFIIKNGTDLELRGNIDIFQWNSRKSLENLNKECDVLHKGSDGKSKLWNDVDIYLSTVIIKKCK